MLEFIRKNSWIALAAIAAILIGFLLMDYAGKNVMGSDRFASVNETNYSYADQVELGENGLRMLGMLSSECQRHHAGMLAQFDTNKDGQLDDKERAAMGPANEAALQRNLEAVVFLNQLYQMWAGIGPNNSKEDTKVMTNRIIVREEAKKYGVYPDKNQTDTFIENLAAFQNGSGDFDAEAYMQFIGKKDGNINKEREAAFHSLVADIIAWNALQAILVDDLKINEAIEGNMLDIKQQTFDLSTAILPRAKYAPSTDPSEEDVKAFWEQNKGKYLSKERRGVTLFTLTPAENVKNDDNFRADIEELYETVMEANGRAVVKQLENASTRTGSEFIVKEETYPLAARDQMAAGLATPIVGADQGIETIADAAFTVEDAPAPAVYEQRKEAGKADSEIKAGQMRGVYSTKDGQYAIIRVNTIEKPTELPYEEARSSALADLKTKLTSDKLHQTAQELFTRMEKEDSLDKAFTIAKEVGAEVATIDKFAGDTANAPEALFNAGSLLLTTDTGKLAPIMEDKDGVLIVGIRKRSVEDDTRQAAIRTGYYFPQLENIRRREIMTDWLLQCYAKYKVQVTQH